MMARSQACPIFGFHRYPQASKYVGHQPDIC
jgi:hypothetical protein